MNASVADGAAFSLMVGMGESFLPAFVLASGLGEVVAGLCATVPMLAGAVMQLLLRSQVRLLGSHRRWVIVCAAVQAASFLPLVVFAFFETASTAAILLIATVYWGAGLSAGPSWNTWMAGIVPATLRPKFFARRTRATQFCAFVGLIIGGGILHSSAASGNPLRGFAVMFLGASIFRMLSSALLVAQSEPRVTPVEEHVPPQHLLRRPHRATRRLISYMMAVQITTHVAGPYFTPFMLGELAFSYSQYVALLGAAFAAKVAALPAMGRIAQRYGARKLLWIGGAAIIPASAYWLISDSWEYLLAVQIVAGVSWAAYELATVLMLFETIPDSQRTSVLTLFNLVNTAAIVGGSMIGAGLLHIMDVSRGGYLLLFAVSAAGRALTLPLLGRVSGVPITRVMVRLRTLSVRPQAGSIDRPILTTIGQASAEDPPNVESRVGS